ncbi:MAG: DUF192 domain-containing protein [Nitrospinota bacterium]|nr:DUF192 domain-containing protein [Nitrospinota bacterium]
MNFARSMAAALVAGIIICGGGVGWGNTVVFLESEARTASVTVEVANTPAQRNRGLMFRPSLKEGQGMWFIFPYEMELAFWMKNVRFPIDIIFIDSKFHIRTIHKSVPPCRTETCASYFSRGKVQYVLEVQSGFCEKNGIRENQKVEYKP